MAIDAIELRNELDEFCGTEGYHKLTLSSLKATDGVAHLAKRAGAFWLVDAIASYQHKPEIKALSIQFWTLSVTKKGNSNSAELYCVEDKDMPKIVTQKIGYTDFPVGEWQFYVADGIMLLPSEY